MRRRAFACGLLAVALAGCSEKPPAALGDSSPTAASPEKSVDEQIAEALKTVDPIVLCERAPLPDDENAFVLLQQGMGDLDDLWGDVKVGPAFEDALEDRPFPQGEPGRVLAEWLAKKAPALATIDAGIALERFQFPEIDGPSTDMSYLAPLRQAARVKLVKAKLLSERGDAKAAAQELIGVLRLGRLLTHGEGAVIHSLVGIAIQGIGTAGVRWFAASDSATDGALVLLLQSLAPDGRPGEDIALGFRVEFTCFCVPSIKWLKEEITSKGAAKTLAESLRMSRALSPGKGDEPSEEEIARLLPRGKLFDVAETVELGAALYARLIRRTLAPWERPPKHEMADTVAILKSWKSDPPPRNPMGQIITDLLVPAMDAAVERSFRVRADRAATRAALALRLFEMRAGRLPGNLDDLVAAGILHSVPVDPFAERPPRYSRERRRVWSVGPDESDDGGRDKPVTWTGKDYVLEVPGGGAP
ncbi:MAG: hypothetical protein ACYTKD_07580 [Planctomycetota bacterium]|jgi:hypothetical protein